MAVQVPVQGGVGEGPKAINYRDVGTNIDCVVVPLPGGGFTVNLTVEDSSVHLDEKAPQIVGLPSFRSFRTQSSVVLRDGQTRQFSVASDKVTGEVTRGEVTLTVVR